MTFQSSQPGQPVQSVSSSNCALLEQVKLAMLAASPAPVVIVDKHMGSGKTTGILNSLEQDRKYLIVVPLLTEVRRIIRGASVPIYQPIGKAGADTPDLANPLAADYSTKRDHLRALIEAGHNVVCSHELFSAIGGIAQEQLLTDYHVLIDEVLNVAEVKTGITQTKKTATGPDPDTGWRELYLHEGFITICPETGRIDLTDKWRGVAEKLSGNLSYPMFLAAEAGRLYTDQARMGKDIIMSELPPALLRNCRSLRVHTYMAEGSFMAAYMRRHGIDYRVEFDPTEDAAFRKRARELVTVHAMPRLAGTKLSYSAQDAEARKRKPGSAVPLALYRAQRTEGELKGVEKDKIMLTCAKACWYAKGNDSLGRGGVFAQGSRLFDGAHWVPNTTRGTNDYAHCSHLIYLWDQHANVNVSRFLGVDDEHHRDLYAVSELLQWVWRSRVRRDEPITLFLPSARMRRLWSRWLDGELQGSNPVAAPRI